MAAGTMTLEIPPDLREIVDRLVASGEYPTEEAVLRRAIRDLAHHEQVMQGLREAMADVAAGRETPLDEFDRTMRAKYDYLSE